MPGAVPIGCCCAGGDHAAFGSLARPLPPTACCGLGVNPVDDDDDANPLGVDAKGALTFLCEADPDAVFIGWDIVSWTPVLAILLAPPPPSTVFPSVSGAEFANSGST